MAVRIVGIRRETIDKWLHQIVDGRSIIDTLLNMNYYRKQRLMYSK
jgi:hypothetical protein